MRHVILIAALWLLLTKMVKAQTSIDDYIDSYIGENAVPYVQPMADIFTSNIHTGVWEWSAMPQEFYLRLKVQGMASFPTEDMRTFSGRTTGTFQPEQTVIVPTIIGSEDGVIIEGNNNEVYVFPGGFDMNRVILGTPQVTIGGFLNSELTGRFLTFDMNNDIDRVRFYGLGARHSISNYFEDAPIDLSVGYMYHHLQSGDYLESDHHLISAHIGKSGRIFSGQFMVGYQTSDSDIHYIYDEGDTETEVNLNLTNKNPFIIEAGFGARLGPVMASTSVSWSEHVAVSVGAGLFF